MAYCARYNDDISTSDLLSFLKLAYTASLPFKHAGDSLVDDYRMVEYTYSISRTPMVTTFFEVDSDPPCKLEDQGILGPQALLHILVTLAKRGLLSGPDNTHTIAKWDVLPEGTIDIALNQVKQITSPAVVTKILSRTFKKLLPQRERGHQALKRHALRGVSNDLLDYMAGAEMAMSIIDLTTILKEGGQPEFASVVKGVRKELVLFLGNASEMALRGNWLYRALMYAMSAVEWSRDMPSDDCVDNNNIEKNRRRVERARNGDA